MSKRFTVNWKRPKVQSGILFALVLCLAFLHANAAKLSEDIDDLAARVAFSFYLFQSKNEKPRFEQITFGRRGCFIGCTGYKVVIQSDGNIGYEGEGDLKTKGKATGVLSAQQLTELSAAILVTDYFSIPDSYHSSGGASGGHSADGRLCSTDSDTVYISISTVARKHSINHYTGCLAPQNLIRFENQIDEIVNISQWIGSPEELTRIQADAIAVFQ